MAKSAGEGRLIARVMLWLFCGPLFLLVGVQGGFRNRGVLWEISQLTCEQKSLVFTLLPNQSEKALPHALRSDPACGTHVEQQASGSVVVEASYSGCYVIQRVRPILGLEGPDVAAYKEELRCPNTHLALDAPSPSTCSAIQASARLPCATPPITQGDCEERGCCYHPGDRVMPCYYGNKATVQCTPDGQISVAISRDVTLPPLDLSSVHLLSSHGSRCAPVSRNEAFVVYRFPLSACGTILQVSGNQRVYENELVADRQVLTSHSGTITRDSTFRLTIRCSYSAEAFLPVNIIVSTLPPPPAAIGQGPLALEMRIAKDGNYSTYYKDSEYPVVRLLRDPVHVEVRILQRMDPSLVLVLHQCWATPSTNPLQEPEWLILVDGCPYEGDNYQTQLVPVGDISGLQFPSHHQRFIVRTFTFVDATSQRALSGRVYFHCSASVCMPSGQEHCTVQCPTNFQGRSKSVCPFLVPFTGWEDSRIWHFPWQTTAALQRFMDQGSWMKTMENGREASPLQG
uniref:Zona pellucida sperm-binding protein 4 n=1 Tax=Pelusios castaneus TaxID=367368 RepID=A0A8C8SGX2_9SAUR